MRPAPTSKSSRPAPSPPLFKADKVTLHLSADKEGHIRVTYQGWDDAKSLLPGERLELFWEGGQVLARRVTKAK